MTADDLTSVQPMRLTHVFGTANRLYGENGKLFLGIVAPPLLLKAILDVLVRPERILLSGCMGLVDLFLITLAVGAVIIAIAARYLGKPMTVANAYRSLGLRGAVVVFLATLLALLFIAVGLVILLIPGLFLLLKFAFVAQIVALERQSVWGSLARSWRFTGGQFGRVLGLSLMNLVFQVVVAALLLPVILVFLHFTGAVGAFLISLLGILGVPFFEGLLTVLYFDIAARRTTAPAVPASVDAQVAAGASDA